MNHAIERFHARGRDAVVAGEEVYDRPPSVDSPRWGVSAILRPDDAAAEALARLTGALSAVAGEAHWPTGRLGSSHLTVRDLERYRDPVPADDPLLGRYNAAVARAAKRSGPLTFTLTGLVLTPGGVLMVAEPTDPAPAQLRATLARELGADGCYQHAGYRRDLWWSTLLHFAEPLTDGAALVDWVEARRTLDPAGQPGVFRARTIDLVRYEYDGAGTVPVTLAAFPLGA